MNIPAQTAKFHPAAWAGAFLTVFLGFLLGYNNTELSPDGWAYWEGSVSLLTGHGYRYFGGTPIIHWPPGLSAFASGLRCRLTASGVRVVEIKPGLVDTPMTAELKKSWLFASPECIARGIASAAQRGPATAYLPWFWKPIMRFISILPERVFVKLPL